MEIILKQLEQPHFDFKATGDAIYKRPDIKFLREAGREGLFPGWVLQGLAGRSTQKVQQVIIQRLLLLLQGASSVTLGIFKQFWKQIRQFKWNLL